ncbi:MAG: BrnT family toxin [Patescibacteria group bacterium]
MNTSFEWDKEKNVENLRKHGVDFETAQYVFLDPKRVVAEDTAHSKTEKRYYVFGKVKGGVLTVRFTHRNNRIRIIGAGYWRKGKKIYEKQNKIQ